MSLMMEARNSLQPQKRILRQVSTVSTIVGVSTTYSVDPSIPPFSSPSTFPMKSVKRLQ